MSTRVEFLRAQYILGRLAMEQVNSLFDTGKITSEERDYIMT